MNDKPEIKPPKCILCFDTGKVIDWDNMELGMVKYKQCGKCKGKGVVK